MQKKKDNWTKNLVRTMQSKNKLDFSNVSDQVIQTKDDKVSKIYDECVKMGKYDALNVLFDITKVKGEWLSTEHKQLYHQQVKSKGEVGYSRGEVANKETIHTSKRQKLTAESSYNIKINILRSCI